MRNLFLCAISYSLFFACAVDKLTKGELHSTLVGEAAERFGGRLEEKFRFLGRYVPEYAAVWRIVGCSLVA